MTTMHFSKQGVCVGENSENGAWPARTEPTFEREPRAVLFSLFQTLSVSRARCVFEKAPKTAQNIGNKRRTGTLGKTARTAREQHRHDTPSAARTAREQACLLLIDKLIFLKLKVLFVLYVEAVFCGASQ